ncbi:hypothetical protein H6P81_016635 [Aristolochia fimbriata]|uniref:Uncharacterized protein n=1 Tax=Aristolochia fimbriata TaxID=158543 RepID=A0AAV7E8W2_ARIFI|nr:hypothetical protein H6P81_016635 [Aristolochia fimbriata]
MGGRLCVLIRQSIIDERQPNDKVRRPKMGEKGDGVLLAERGSNILGFFKPSCLRMEKKRHVTALESFIEKPSKLKKLSTLEEWLAASPACMKRDHVTCTTTTSNIGSSQYSSRVCPWTDQYSSSSLKNIINPSRFGPNSLHDHEHLMANYCSTTSMENSPNFCQAQDSVCVERERRHLAHEGSNTITGRSQQSGKPKKKVSFRLPDESDIRYISYSQEGERGSK